MPWPEGCVWRDQPLANHTSFRIGGPAEWFAQPKTIEELREVLRQAARLGLPLTVVGGGTNTLAADRGVRGVVIHLSRGFRGVDIVSSPEESMARVRCGAGVLTQRLVYLAAKHGWGELELLAGLPGQIGGAVTMNAQHIGRFVRQVTQVALDGTVRQVAREQLRFGYRDSSLEPGIIVEVELEFPRIPAAQAYERIHRALAYRNTTQDLRVPSAGCAFKNPPGLAAGRLIDQSGLKGLRVGDAQISTRHANFIVNLGQASCDDVLGLMEHVQRLVWKQHGVVLEPEVRLVGERWPLAPPQTGAGLAERARP